MWARWTRVCLIWRDLTALLAMLQVIVEARVVEFRRGSYGKSVPLELPFRRFGEVAGAEYFADRRG